jgi:hypothetical protein
VTNPNDLAFPLLSSTVEGQTGLTKREYFAALMMQSYVINLKPCGAAEKAIECADALIAALNDQEGQP